MITFLLFLFPFLSNGNNDPDGGCQHLGMFLKYEHEIPCGNMIGCYYYEPGRIFHIDSGNVVFKSVSMCPLWGKVYRNGILYPTPSLSSGSSGSVTYTFTEPGDYRLVVQTGGNGSGTTYYFSIRDKHGVTGSEPSTSLPAVNEDAPLTLPGTDEATAVISYTIYNSWGQQVYVSSSPLSSAAQISLQMMHLPAGIYIADINYSDQRREMRKILIP